jgi:DNA-binding transcriptional LysR family regulator
MDWNDHQLILEVHRSGSFLGAARQLGLSPSTVMRRVDALETRAGKALFHRTQQGVRLEEDALPLASLAEQFESALAAHERDRQNIVRLSVPEGLGSVAAEAARRCLSRGVDLSVELITDTRYLDLARREADIAVRAGRSSSQVLLEKRLGVVVPSLAASPDYLERHLPRRKLALGEYGAQHFVGDQHLRSSQWLVERGARIFPFRANTVEARVQAARAGLGLTVLVKGSQYEGLVEVAIDEPPALTFYLVMHRSLRKVERMRAFAASLEALIRELR